MEKSIPQISSLLVKYPTTCEKHAGNENTSLCKACDCLLCLECIFEHEATYSDHKLISMSDFAVSTVKLLEKARRRMNRATRYIRNSQGFLKFFQKNHSKQKKV